MFFQKSVANNFGTKGKSDSMRILIEILIIAAFLLPTSGCLEELIGGKDMLASNVDTLMVKVDELQVVYGEVAKTNIINVKETRKRNAAIDEIQEMIVSANEAIKESPTLIEGIIKANQVTAPLNPYAGVIDAVLKVIVGAGVVGTAGMGLKAAKTSKEKKKVENDRDNFDKKYSAFKRASDRFRLKHPESAEDHFKLVGEERVKVGIT